MLFLWCSKLRSLYVEFLLVGLEIYFCVYEPVNLDNCVGVLFVPGMFDSDVWGYVPVMFDCDVWAFVPGMFDREVWPFVPPLLGTKVRVLCLARGA